MSTSELNDEAVSNASSPSCVSSTPAAIYLKTLKISGFRKLSNACIELPWGLSIIVGENNSGKTAIVDAIRALLGDYQIKSDDFNRDPQGNTCRDMSIAGVFSGLNLKDQGLLIDALISSDAETFDAQMSLRATRNEDDVRSDFLLGAGLQGNTRDVRSQLRCIYLQPLRDPESTYGLKPGRYSQIAKLVKRFAPPAEQHKLEELARKANKELSSERPIQQAQKQLGDNLRALSGPQYPQSPSLVFTSPEFDRIVGTLEALAHEMPISLNGLGASNLYFIAAVLGDLEQDSSVRHRLLLIEEPEAHLHPQLQVLLLRFLRLAVDWPNNLQVIVTTHSPIFASKAAAESLCVIRSDVESLTAGPVSFDPASDAAMRVRQYLDATRSELFFARRLILVEGDAELLLLSSLARQHGLDLVESGTSVVSVAGLNFELFLPFIKGDVLGVRVAILTDGDPLKARPSASSEPAGPSCKDDVLDEDPPDYGSAYSRNLKAKVGNDTHLNIFCSEVTFEYDLAIPVSNRELLVMAVEATVGPRSFKRISASLDSTKAENWPRVFFEEVFESKTASKARFAQELALILDAKPEGSFTVPGYLADAFRHVATPSSSEKADIP
jgi:putative ATP-dependent endonuclease of OLD family